MSSLSTKSSRCAEGGGVGEISGLGSQKCDGARGRDTFPYLSPHALGQSEEQKRRPDAGAGGELCGAERLVKEEYAEEERDRRTDVLEKAEDVQWQAVRAVGFQ